MLWSIGYALFALCCALSAWISRDYHPIYADGGRNHSQEDPPPTFSTKLLWLSLSACGSMMLLAVTNHLSENVAPVPLLWVVPLALYLLSFAMVFAKAPVLFALARGTAPGRRAGYGRLRDLRFFDHARHSDQRAAFLHRAFCCLSFLSRRTCRNENLPCVTSRRFT